jgi:6-pyruvoyl-tetrahydropterin synthase
MVMTIGTSVAFEAAHRQLGDPSKCGGLHGHNWVADVTIDGTELGPLGYLTDFKLVKDTVNQLDHVTVLHKDDPLVAVLNKDCKTKVVVLENNPTCETIARVLADMLFIRLNGDHNIVQVTVTLWENSKSWARATS